MYTPPGCNTLANLPLPQIRLGVQGYGGTGKTWSMLTFPNPVVFNIDNGLGAHIGREDVIEVPIWDPTFCAKIHGAGYTKYNLRDVIDKWFDTYGPKLEKGQTLGIDGNTGLQNAYHLWYSNNVSVSSGGKVNEFAEWRMKQQFYTPLLEALKYLKCDVVFLCHEADKKEKNGEYLGKVRPLLSGSIGDELLTHFTDWFRQHSADKPTGDISAEKLALWGLDKAQFTTMMSSFKGNNLYFWQTEGDNIFDAKRSSLVNAPRFIPASYSSFLKYRKQVTTQSSETFKG